MERDYEFHITDSGEGWKEGFVKLYDDESDTPDFDYETPVKMMGDLENPNNTVLFTASMHGNEYLASRICLEMMDNEELKENLTGRAVFMPCLNFEGMFQKERSIPRGGRDLNRAFKERSRLRGKRPESYAERIGNGLLEYASDVADVVVDLHCWTYNSDAFVVTERIKPGRDIDEEKLKNELRRICDAFQKPATIGRRTSGYLISALVNERQTPAVIFEIGPKSTTPYTDDEVLRGELRNVMIGFDVLEGSMRKTDEDYDDEYLYTRRKVYSNSQGIFIEEADLHTELEEGTQIGRVVNRFGRTKEEVKMPDDGVITAFVDHKTVTPGDELCHTGLRNDQISFVRGPDS